MSYKKNNAKELFQDAASKIIDLMEQNGSDWLKPFASVSKQKNPISESVYRGFNQFYLSICQINYGYSSPYWATYNQLKSKKIWIKKSEVKNSHPVFFYSIVEKEDKETGEIVKYPVLRVFRVYNADQLDDPGALKTLAAEVDFGTKITSESKELANDLVSALDVELVNGNPCYYPGTNKVAMLPESKFVGESEYFATLFHELTHAVSDKTVLDLAKDNAGNKGSTDYAFDELVAEMGSAMLCGYFEYSKPETDTNHAKYLNGWIKAIKDKPNILMTACSAAEKASEYVVGRYNLLKMKPS